jgi:nucleoside-diphosphate-sugar epimerase
MESNNIVLHTAGNSEGNYCYLRDAIKAIFTVLFNGQAGETYNVSNEKNHMTIAQMAHLVATEVAVPTIEVIHDIPDEISSFGYAPDTKLKLNTAKIRSLGWEPEIGLRDMYLRMIESMKVRH